MAHNILFEALRKAFPAHERALEEVESSPVVREILDRSEAIIVAERTKLKTELDALPKKYAKAIDAATRDATLAAEAVAKAEIAVAAARARYAVAAQIPQGLESAERQAADKLRAELQRTASPLISAAHRGVYALSVQRFAPDYERAFVPNVDERDAHALAQRNQALDEVTRRNARAGEVLDAALAAQRLALAKLDALMLEPFGEADVFERVAEILADLNTSLQPLKHSPAILMDNRGEVTLQFDEYKKAFTVKAADISKEAAK